MRQRSASFFCKETEKKVSDVADHAVSGVAPADRTQMKGFIVF